MRRFIWTILVFLRIFHKERWVFRDACKLEKPGFIKMESNTEISNVLLLVNGHKYFNFSLFYTEEGVENVKLNNILIECQLEECFLNSGFRYAFIFWWELVIKKQDYVRFNSDGTVEIQ